MATAPPPLAGIRVVEMGTMVFAPAACATLADFGAEIVKIEPPGQGDLSRHYHNMPGMPISELSYTFQADNRNKKSIAIDVKSDAGYQAFSQLIAKADLFVTNYRPSALTKLRLTYDDLKPIQPRLIYALGTAFGEQGAERDHPGYDSVSYWSRSSIETHIFPLEGWLTSFPYGAGDHPSGTALFGAIMLGLYQRQLTGEGCKVSTSLLANGAWANATMLQAALANAKFQQRRPRDRAYNFTYLHYKSSDGRIVRLCIVNIERQWAPFCRAIGRPELIDDPRFAAMNDRVENMGLLIGIIDEAFLAHDANYWKERLKQFDIPYAVLPTYQETAIDPQMQMNEIIVPLQHPRLGEIATVSSPLQIENCPKQTATAAPELGQHTCEVLGDLGYTAAEIEQLITDGVVQQYSEEQ